MDKIFEKMLHSRLVSYFNSNHLLNENQFGFCKGRDTQEAVLKLLDCILPVFNDSTYCICVFADFSKAFDTVNHDLLLKKLNRYGVRGIAHQLMTSFLTDRSQYVSCNNVQSSNVIVDVSVLQGSCLGPFLYNVYTNDMFKIFDESNCECIMYADDTTIVGRGCDLDALCLCLNIYLLKFTDWCKYNKLKFNPSKTKWMLSLLKLFIIQNF